MTTISVAAVIFALTAVMSAVVDTLSHQWNTSLFASRGSYNKHGYWGEAPYSWLRRYRQLDPKRGYVEPLKNPVVRFALLPVWDGWHLMKTLQVVGASALFTMVVGGTWPWIIVAYAGWTSLFEVFYQRVLKQR